MCYLQICDSQWEVALTHIYIGLSYQWSCLKDDRNDRWQPGVLKENTVLNFERLQFHRNVFEEI